MAKVLIMGLTMGKNTSAIPSYNIEKRGSDQLNLVFLGLKNILGASTHDIHYAFHTPPDTSLTLPTQFNNLDGDVLSDLSIRGFLDTFDLIHFFTYFPLIFKVLAVIDGRIPYVFGPVIGNFDYADTDKTYQERQSLFENTSLFLQYNPVHFLAKTAADKTAAQTAFLINDATKLTTWNYIDETQFTPGTKATNVLILHDGSEMMEAAKDQIATDGHTSTVLNEPFDYDSFVTNVKTHDICLPYPSFDTLQFWTIASYAANTAVVSHSNNLKHATARGEVVSIDGMSDTDAGLALAAGVNTLMTGGNLATKQAAALAHAGTIDTDDTLTFYDALVTDVLDKADKYSADGAVTIPRENRTVLITKTGSAAALTLADPTTVIHDGVRLCFISSTAFAHKVDNSAGSGFSGLGATKDVATFGGSAGDSFEIIGLGGIWYVLNLESVTIGAS